VDEAMLGELAAAARRAGIKRLLARYTPTAKNGMVSDHYDKLGFTLVSEGEDGGRAYEADPEAMAVAALPFARAMEAA
jgi:predicted enzyme involved in methoxymalonyl-ACP biosynthesis